MFTIYILKKIETNLQPGRGIGTIVDVSQRAVEPNFPTGTIYRSVGPLARASQEVGSNSFLACPSSSARKHPGTRLPERRNSGRDEGVDLAEVFGQHTDPIARLDGDEAEGCSGEDELSGREGAAECIQVAFEPGEGP